MLKTHCTMGVINGVKSRITPIKEIVADHPAKEK
jgi:hypothetical protein